MRLVVDLLACSLANASAAGDAPASAADHTLLPMCAQSEAAPSAPPTDAAPSSHQPGVSAQREEVYAAACDVPAVETRQGKAQGSWRLVFQKQGRAGAMGMHVM